MEKNVIATPTAEAAPTVQNAPSAEAMPTVQNAPSAQAASSVQNVPSAEDAPTIQNAPSVQAASSVQNAPSAEAMPRVQSMPNAINADEDSASIRESDGRSAFSSADSCDCSDSCSDESGLPSDVGAASERDVPDPTDEALGAASEDDGQALTEQAEGADEEDARPDVREGEDAEDGEDYARRAEEDMRELCSLFPALAPDGQALKLGELQNPTRFAELREAGLTVEEAFLASNYRMLNTRPIELGARAETKAHLRPSLPRSRGRGTAMPTSLLLRTRALFEGMTDRELASLYRRVTE